MKSEELAFPKSYTTSRLVTSTRWTSLVMDNPSGTLARQLSASLVTFLSPGLASGNSCTRLRVNLEARSMKTLAHELLAIVCRRWHDRRRMCTDGLDA